MTQITTEMLAWAAGFIDAEGCISIVRGQGRRSPNHYVSIQVGNNDLPPLQVLADMFGGTVKTRKTLYGTSKTHFSWWSRSSGPALQAIADLSPYLVSKREEADLVVEFGKRPTAMGRRRLSADLLRQREDLCAACQQAKRTRRVQSAEGVAAPPHALAWAAGFLDGEGCISIGTGRASADKSRVTYFPQLEIGHVDPRPLHIFQTLFGGHMRLCNARGKGRQPITYWCIRGVSALDAAADMRPWLVAKSSQAAEMLKFRSLLSSTNHVRLSSDNETARANLKRSLASMKSAKGVKHG